MAKYLGNALTNLGKDLLARSVASKETITFTKVELGKGVFNGNSEELAELVESFKVLDITGTTKLEGGSYRVRAAFNNVGMTEDIYLREIGLFARGEDGVEILYSYCYTDTPDLIPAEGSGVIERVEDIITYISNAANINAVIDQSKVYVTVKDFIEGLAGKEDSFNKNTAFNKDFGTTAGTVADGEKVENNTNAISNNGEQIERLSKVEILYEGNLLVKETAALAKPITNYGLILIQSRVSGRKYMHTVPTNILEGYGYAEVGGFRSLGRTHSFVCHGMAKLSEEAIENYAVYSGPYGGELIPEGIGSTALIIEKVLGILPN